MPRFHPPAGRRVLRGLLALLLLHLFLQTLWAHRAPLETAGAGPADLRPILDQTRRSEGDDDTLFLQTGLSPAAVDALLARGAAGRAQIFETQAALAAPRAVVCQPLIPGRVTCEDLLSPAAPRIPLAPLEPGDLLVTFSTHTEGWRHGHAGLAVGGGAVLEATKLGSSSGRQPLDHWADYAAVLVLRVRDAPAADRAEAVRYALAQLDGLPYSPLSGLGPQKLPEAPAAVQCAYLPWCAWAHCGYDLDSDGGRIVTVVDLAASPLLEVVQVWGLDPAPYAGRLARPAPGQPAEDGG